MPSHTVAPSGTLEQDLDRLTDILEDNVPAYVLVRLDDPPTEWLAIYYVPDTAKVRDKVCIATIEYPQYSALTEIYRCCTLRRGTL